MAEEIAVNHLKEQMDAYQAEYKSVQRQLDEKLDKLQSSLDSLTARFDEQTAWMKRRFGGNSGTDPISVVPVRSEVEYGAKVVDLKDKEDLLTSGTTASFEEENRGANNVGFMIIPVRLTGTDEFGTSQFVADKLIPVEKRKEITKDAEVIAVRGKGGPHVYEFEHKLNSTRGRMKRIFSAAFVASNKLCLLNIAHSDKLESPFDGHTRTILVQVLQMTIISKKWNNFCLPVVFDPGGVTVGLQGYLQFNP